MEFSPNSPSSITFLLPSHPSSSLSLTSFVNLTLIPSHTLIWETSLHHTCLYQSSLPPSLSSISGYLASNYLVTFHHDDYVLKHNTLKMTMFVHMSPNSSKSSSSSISQSSDTSVSTVSFNQNSLLIKVQM